MSKKKKSPPVVTTDGRRVVLVHTQDFTEVIIAVIRDGQPGLYKALELPATSVAGLRDALLDFLGDRAAKANEDFTAQFHNTAKGLFPNTEIRDVGVNPHVVRALRDENVTTLSDLSRLSASDVGFLKNTGPAAVATLRIALASCGLSFKGESAAKE